MAPSLRRDAGCRATRARARGSAGPPGLNPAESDPGEPSAAQPATWFVGTRPRSGLVRRRPGPNPLQKGFEVRAHAGPTPTLRIHPGKKWKLYPHHLAVNVAKSGFQIGQAKNAMNSGLRGVMPAKKDARG